MPHNATARLVTRSTVEAARNAAADNPDTLSAAVRLAAYAARSHKDADEVADLAVTIAAAYLPEPFRLGYGAALGYAQHPATENELARLAQHAAAAAVRRAAAAVAEENARTLSLDALTDADPTALDALTGDDRRATLTKWAPVPDARYRITGRDLIDGARTVVTDPTAAAMLAAAIDAWTPEARSLSAVATAALAGKPLSPSRRTVHNRIADALTDVHASASTLRLNPFQRIDRLRTAQHTPAQADAAAAQVERPGMVRPETDEATASHVVRTFRLDPNGYPAALGYGPAVEAPAQVLDATTGALIAPAVDYAATMTLHQHPAHLAPRTVTPVLADPTEAGQADAKAGARIAARIPQGTPKASTNKKGNRVGAYGSVVAQAPHLMGMTGR